MREGLAREFPEAERVLAWTRARLPARALVVVRERPLWAAVSAAGAAFAVSSITQFAVGLAFNTLQALGVTSPLMITLGWLGGLLGTAAGVAVALRAGGPLALAAYLAFVALSITLQIPGLRTFCERAGPESPLALEACTPLGFVASHWAQWVGVGLGLLASRGLAPREGAGNPMLRVAGAYAVAWSAALWAWTLTVTQGADAASALSSSLTIAALTAATAVVAGVVAGLSPHRVHSAATVAVLVVLPWLTVQLPLLVMQAPTVPPDYMPSMLVGALSVPFAAALLVLTAVIADRRRFIPRDTA